MTAFRCFGLILTLALISGKGRTQAAIPEDDRDQETEASDNAYTVTIPLGSGNVIQSSSQVSPQRRLSLEDFFLNNNNNNQRQAEPVLQQPVAQFQVQQPDPNSLLLVRDAQFPSPTGGLISRMLLARRMLRLRRIARRLTLLPRLMGLGLTRTIARSAGLGPSPLSLFAKRSGDAYNPRDYVFGNKAFSYSDNASNSQQQDASNDPLQHQQSRGIPVGAEPYYNTYDEGNYDPLDNSNIGDLGSYENQDLSLDPNAINSLSNEQQLLLLQQLQKYQDQLNQLQLQLNQQQINIPNTPNPPQTLQNQAVRQNYENNGQNVIGQNQGQPLSDRQLEQVRQLQLELLREQQLQQQELQRQLQKLQLAQQAQNLRQHQQLNSAEHEQTYQDRNPQQPQPNVPNDSVSAAGERTGGPSYNPSFNLGTSSGGNYGGGPGKSIGVGVNVGIGPPAVDIQVTKPGAPGYKPLPPLVNPIGPKPVPAAPAEPPLVPLGILPKPILNLKGRVFFGAEMGKNAGLQANTG